MGFFTLLLLAFCLSADAFAVAVTDGMCDSEVTRQHAFFTALSFGFFQALMPVIGFCLGRSFYELISRYQHWVAFLLLSAIGINMLFDAKKEGRKAPELEICEFANLFSAKSLIMQGIATSIDALAAGVSIAALKINIFTAAALIGLITFVLCIIGVEIGKRFGSLLGLRAKVIGGIVLIGIGTKILLENQFL